MEETREITCKSGKVVVIRELNALEQTNADRAAKDPLAILSYRAAMSIASIDGEPVGAAKNDLALDERLQKLSGRDLREISDAFVQEFQLTDDDLKNASRLGS